MKKLLMLLTILLVSTKCFCFDYVTIPNTFVARQLISASQIMANYNALANAITDGTIKINVAEVYINSTLAIDNSRNISAGTLSSTIATANTLNVVTSNITALCDVTGLFNADNLSIDGQQLYSTTLNVEIYPVTGSMVLLDNHWGYDGVTMSAQTDADTIMQAYATKSIIIEDVDFDGGVVTAVTDLTVGNVNIVSQAIKNSYYYINSGIETGTQNTWYTIHTFASGARVSGHIYVNTNEGGAGGSAENAIFEFGFESSGPSDTVTKVFTNNSSVLAAQISGVTLQIRTTAAASGTLYWTLTVSGRNIL